MAQPAIGQATRDRMARNYRQLGDRFTDERWRASRYAGPENYRTCAAATKAGEPCGKSISWGGRKDSAERPDWDHRADVFYCTTHATALLAQESAR